MPGRPDDSSLRLKKQQFVRSEIWNAAVDLFAEHGYDRTTVDDIANAAGVSRRTFFRYFASKDDVMVQATDTYGDLLVEAVKESAGAAPLQIVERAVRRLAAFVVVQPRARLAMQIVPRESERPRRAVVGVLGDHRARGAGVRGRRCRRRRRMRPTLLASLTFVLLLNRVFQSWYERSERQSGRSSTRSSRRFTTLGACPAGTRRGRDRGPRQPTAAPASSGRPVNPPRAVTGMPRPGITPRHHAVGTPAKMMARRSSEPPVRSAAESP